MMTIFTPSFADEADTNAQNLTVKEIVARLSPDRFRVLMFYEDAPDPRISGRPNTRFLRWRPHGNSLRTMLHCWREPPDVYFYPREGPLDAALLYFRRSYGLPTALVTYVVSGGLDRGARPTLARNIREADAVFGNCCYVSELVHSQLGRAAETIYDGIDRRFFFPSRDKPKRNNSGKDLTVLYAGSFRSYKRVDRVVRQAARWPQVQFRVAGRGEEETACRRLVERLQCCNVSFLGHLSLPELGEKMRQADVFFFPSILEGHPQVLGQAAACGLPVVAMNSYRPDYVVDGYTGFLAASDEEMERRLDLLLTRPDLRESMSQAAIDHAQQFDWEPIAHRWQDAFEIAVERRRNQY